MGGDVVTWTDQAEIWAAAEPLTGREFFAAQQDQGEIDIRFRIRYRTDVNNEWRIIWGGNPYEIVTVVDVNGRHAEQHIFATTQQNENYG